MKMPLDELDLLGFKPSEKKILIAIHKMGKPISMISRHTGIPRTSLLYMLTKLKERGLVTTVIFGKRTWWKADNRIRQNLKSKK